MTAMHLDFEQALRKSDAYGKRHLLLGNGFSIACKPDIFAYGSLFEEAKKTMSRELAAIFAAMGTQDFEEVIRALQHAATIVGVYRPSFLKTQKLLLDDADKLKTDLIQAVASRHPARPNDISDERYTACRSFLSNFVGDGVSGKIYTMNYDLLLYWALMHEEDDVLARIDLTHDDGFRKDQNDYDAPYVEWQGEGAAHGQNIHYLHGALHLFDAGYQLQKYTWINTGKALVDQANEALKKNLFPVFVAEGDSRSKLTKIQHSAYLHHNYKSFAGVCQTKSRGGTALFVYGHSFASNDAHILNMIGYGKIAHLFVSLYGDPSSKANLAIRNNVEKIVRLRPKYFPELKVDFFDAVSAKVWG
ncbi:hypothetical protein AVO45_19135 [Ruegeria marisrubri]|uniref:DUF4917 domain-containing protein n=1 Tax=Ruegeria marisrubri TaxID=1685379 RepID=A0A0X3TST9_9RHOB|nr:DUF4917 family protein [Ruegeria marisrubri]KUJ78767.1 hypothetical protein AVO45_19135 [Ruegeria marisrubri]